MVGAERASAGNDRGEKKTLEQTGSGSSGREGKKAVKASLRQGGERNAWQRLIRVRNAVAERRRARKSTRRGVFGAVVRACLERWHSREGGEKRESETEPGKAHEGDRRREWEQKEEEVWERRGGKKCGGREKQDLNGRV
eukprot:6209107-Pleurochrysis_carterae.AAC.2